MDIRRDLENISLKDLDISIRTIELFSNLKISTLGELLSMPTINCSKFSKYELEEIFEEFEVSYNGVFKTTESTIKILQANGGVTERWGIIKSWLLEHRPSLLLGFLEPATNAQIKKAEVELNCTLPKEYSEFLCLHNGQKDIEPMVWTCSLLSVEQLASRKQSIIEVFDNPNESRPDSNNSPIKPIIWSNQWIPIGISARGRDILCLDLDPTEHGKSGQVILTSFDSKDYLLLAPSFKEFLSLYFQQIQTGEIEINND